MEELNLIFNQDVSMRYKPTRFNFPKKLVIHLYLLACIPMFLIGCASVKQEPFVKYRAAVQQAQSGIDAAMSVNYNWTRSGFIENFSTNKTSKFSQLIIIPGEGYNWTLRVAPIYLDIKQTRSALAELNEAFVEYADLLVRLSGGNLVSTDKFDQLAKDLNKNSKDALEALNVSAPQQGVALFSTAASEAARLYIENKRQRYLVKSITENQTNVKEYSDRCVSLVHTIRGNMKTYYKDRIEPIELAWSAAKDDKRIKHTEAMLNLNEQFADAIQVLQELETAYQALPTAHEDLAKAIEDPKFDSEGIQKLYSSARRLQQLYTELKKAESK